MLHIALKNMLRGWKKSLLFWILLVWIALFFLTSAVLALGLKSYGDRTYASYRSIGLFEYVGGAYPDETIPSEDAASAAEALNALHLDADPRVLQWDVPVKAIGYHEAITRRDLRIPYYENAVLLVKTGASKGDPWYWYVTVEQELYSVRKSAGKRIKLNTNAIPLEPNHYYCVHGYYTAEGSPLLIFNVHSYRNAAAEADGLDGSIERMIEDVTTPDGGYAIPKDGVLSAIAETYRVLNNGLELFFTADVESLLPFEQETLYLTDGRYFTAEEYRDGEPVCIVTEGIAERLGVGVGDSVSLRVASDPQRALSETYWYGSGFDAELRFTVVGIANASEDYFYAVFAPKAAFRQQAGCFTYTLGVARLDNDGAEAFYADVAERLPENVRLQIYDQGWNAVSAPLRSVRKTVAWLSALSVAAMLTLAVVFGYLFVYSDRKTAQIMTRLGTNRIRVCGHYLIGAGLIVCTAAAVGATGSAALLPRIVAALDRTVTGAAADHMLDYSNAALSFARPLEPLPAPETDLLLLGAGTVVLLVLLSCALFAVAAMKRPTQRRETKSRRTHRGKSAALIGGAFRYAALSVLRGGARSAAPVAVTLLCAVLLLTLAATKQSYTEQLAAIRSNTKIQGVYTDLSGRRTDGLVIDAGLINALYRTGMVEDVAVSGRRSFYYEGRVVTDGDRETLEYESMESTPQSFEKYADILTGDRLIFTNDLCHHPLFGSREPVVRWLDGYDASVFSAEDRETVTRTVEQAPVIPPKGAGIDVASMLTEQTEVVAPLVVTERFLEDHAVSVGDVVQFQQQTSEYEVEPVRYRIAGSYHSYTEVNRLFCPLVYLLPPELLRSEETDAEALRAYTFENARFTLKHSGDLSALKAFFRENGYSEVRQIRKYRTFVVLNDSSFLYTTAQLEKRIAALPTFDPIAIGVGIAVAFVLVFLRRKEVRIMRLLGTTRPRAWLSLWLEQLMLCTAGVGTALLGFWLLKRTLPTEGLIQSAILFVGTLFGAGLSAALISIPKRSVTVKEV